MTYIVKAKNPIFKHLKEYSSFGHYTTKETAMEMKRSLKKSGMIKVCIKRIK